jgi:protein-S-isoprenylcysteine O-methyltransferase Ste14
MEWLRLAGIILVALAALLALVAMVLMSQSPESAPIVITRR